MFDEVVNQRHRSGAAASTVLVNLQKKTLKFY